MVIVVLLSFGRTTSGRLPGLRHHPRQLRALWDEVYLRLFLRSLLYALATVVLCALIAYPVAYAIALHGGRYKNALIAAIVVPFFASYLIRMYAWKALLSDDGLVNSALRSTGLGDGVSFLNTPVRGDRRPRLRLRGVHDPADLRLPRADGRLADRGRQGPLPLAAAHLLHRDAAGHARRPVRRHAAGLPARARRLRQRAAARRLEHLHDRQPDPAAVRRGPELAARLGDDGRA